MFFSEKVFIFGAGFKKYNVIKWQLVNFLLGEAKMAVYVSRRNKAEGRTGHEATPVFLCNVRARIWLEYRFYKAIGDLDAFKQHWCYNNIISVFDNDGLIFAQNFISLLNVNKVL